MLLKYKILILVSIFFLAGVFNVSAQETPIFPSLKIENQQKTNIDKTDYVMFLPDIAYQNHDGTISAGIQGWVYEKEHRPGSTHLLALYLGIQISELSPEQKQQLYERTQLFRVDSERGKHLIIKDKKGQVFTLPTTGNDGRTSALLNIDVSTLNRPQKIAFNLHDSSQPAFADQAIAFYAPPTGLSIISDIDDTIKESAVGDTKQLLINTFLEDFTPVDGMSAWYESLNKNSLTAFHYVSSSPIQLYPVLIDFIEQSNYPRGTMHLREATRWTNMIASSQTSINHKNNAIERILKAYPKRKFILIGDSGENDPMIYASFMRNYPEQICAIIIRDVNNHKDPEHYKTVFSGLNPDTWLVTNFIKDMKQFTDTKCHL